MEWLKEMVIVTPLQPSWLKKLVTVTLVCGNLRLLWESGTSHFDNGGVKVMVMLDHCLNKLHCILSSAYQRPKWKIH